MTTRIRIEHVQTLFESHRFRRKDQRSEADRADRLSRRIAGSPRALTNVSSRDASRVGRLHGISWPAHAEDVHLVARKLFWGSHESAENSRRRGKDEVRIKKEESAFAQGYGERGGDGVPPRRVAELGFLGDSRRSSKPEVRRRKVSLRCAPKPVRRWCSVEGRINYESRSR